ncbi:MAG TPA: UDP-N-acetylmuramoyl-L-alanine--D-glutamate ligase, partial [Acidimicrobiia bacterium]
QGFAVTMFDAQPSPDAFGSGIGLAAGPWDHLLLTGVDLVVASPGFSERSAPVVDTLEAGIRIWSEIEFASQYIDVPMIAVTGTNGKTTVTEVTSQMLEASGIDAPPAGNIGAPLSDFVGRNHDALVVETSSFQLRFIDEFHPVAAAITNVAVDHLDWHGSAGAYAAAKRNIYRNQDETDLLVFDADDDGAAELARHSPGARFPVSGTILPEGGGGRDGDRLVVGDIHVSIGDLPNGDPTHLVNLAFGAALSSWLGADPEAIAQAALSFRPGKHRREVVAEIDGVVWVDDSKATNPHAAIASIRSRDSVVLIAGGLAKGIDVSPIAREPNLSAVIGIGEAGPGLAEAAGAVGQSAETLEMAIQIAARVARPGDTVLLAPGCASFDQFESYVARGDRFQELVNQLIVEVNAK